MRYRPEPVTLWCSARNSIPALDKNPGRRLALIPCTAASCPEWQNGMAVIW